ncbi:hypothetical protein [Achromobacter sp. 413638]|uniref:hypothetical protein n=1 Tax=Achromobacter sp. 413638 TaxID=3342385 RepID=UPI00324BCC81
MDRSKAIELATQYLIEKRIGFSEPVRVVGTDDSCWEVIFLVPLALDPNCVVDPPDVRVMVHADSGKASLVLSM